MSKKKLVNNVSFYLSLITGLFSILGSGTFMVIKFSEVYYDVQELKQEVAALQVKTDSLDDIYDGINYTNKEKQITAILGPRNDKN